MTVIVWDGKTLAADREAGTRYIKCTLMTKIQRLADGRLLGVAGDAALARELAEWVKAGAKPDSFPAECRPGKANTAMVMVITTAGRVQVYESGPYPLEFLNDRHAIGAGTDAALAVLALGHDAETAVRIASEVCNGVGGGIDILQLAGHVSAPQ
ncbi:hypothetical protein [Variovorax paradoxus]|uniref:hypothetical protein n=1 Tax=Variovorax paradoxus TaxID=34073 RepID=UPI00193362C3|nr:hypothetical protein INQ48_13900 [Variovorax paradoxus]